MQYTTNLNLKKPAQTDYYNVDDFNDNADTLDTAVAGIQTNLKGTSDYILTGAGTTADPVWKAPLMKKSTGSMSVTQVVTGGDNTASGQCSAAFGIGNNVVGAGACAFNFSNNVNTQYSAAFGDGNTVTTGTSSFVTGSYNNVSGNNAFAAGLNNIASGNRSVAIGSETTASGSDSFAANSYTTASGNFATALGYQTIASGSAATACGWYNSAGNYQAVFGKYATISDGSTAPTDTTGDVLKVGIGTTASARSNALRISADGNCYGKSSFKASGADFAEYFEWLDGNPNNDERRGLFVTLDGEKIRLATTNDDYILGVVSANPTITGDTQSEVWKGMYMTDVFGVPLKETNDTETRFIINPNYQPQQNYVSRDKRKEWAAIGLVGKLIVVDDGTCQVNGYCKVGADSKATNCNSGYRVMSRIDNTHIKILIK